MTPRPPRKPRSVKVEDDLWDAAKAKAEERGDVLSEVIRKFLERYSKRGEEVSDWHLPMTHRVKFEHLEQMGFWDLVTKPAPDECWTMTSQSPDVVRYSVVYISSHITGIGTGVNMNAHRVALALHLGRQLPHDMTVDHLCQNVKCVNPGHLELVTIAENLRRARVRGSVFMHTQPHRTPEKATQSKIAKGL